MRQRNGPIILTQTYISVSYRQHQSRMRRSLPQRAGDLLHSCSERQPLAQWLAGVVLQRQLSQCRSSKLGSPTLAEPLPQNRFPELRGGERLWSVNQIPLPRWRAALVSKPNNKNKSHADSQRANAYSVLHAEHQDRGCALFDFEGDDRSFVRIRLFGRSR